MKISFSDSIYDNKSKIGKIFFVLCVLMLIYLISLPINHVVIHIDEHFTLGLIQLPTADFWKLIISDVHPPLYYLILKLVTYILNTQHLQYDITYVCNLVSIIPYFLILLFSIIKIRKDYGWFCAGFFPFVIISIGEIFYQFLTIRMYSWALLFLLLTFVYFRDVIDKSDRKSWILFTLFTILGAYTHYFLIITAGLIYLMILLYIYLRTNIDRKEELMKWGISLVVSIMAYIPWMLILIRQLIYSSKHHQIVVMSTKDLVNYFTFFATKSTSLSIEFLLIKLIGIIILGLIILTFIRECENKRINETFHIFSGINVYFLTLIVGIFILTFIYKPSTLRFIVPLLGVLWFTISLFMEKISNKKVFVALLILIMILSGFSLLTNNLNINRLHDEGLEEQAVLAQMNNPNSIVVYNGTFNYNCYHYQLDYAKEYSLRKLIIPYNSDCEISSNLTEIIENNPDKDVYIINNMKKDSDVNFGDNIQKTKLGNRGFVTFFKLDLKENNTNQ